jgi:hypothetical protein
MTAQKRLFSRLFLRLQHLCTPTTVRVRAGGFCREAVSRGACRARETVFFPLKTQKFACRFFRNAYYDRMKRVNPRRAVTNTGDRPLKVESFHVRQGRSGFAVGLSWLTSRLNIREERQVLLDFVCPVPAAEQLLEMAL